MAKTPKTPAAGSIIDGEAEEAKTTKKRTNPVQYLQQVLAEGRKVTWTTWKETYISTIMVLIMVVIMAIFFLTVDSILRVLVSWILSVNN